jgi:hypothetical protein
MSGLSHVHDVCEAIRHRVTIPVLLGRPDSAVPGLYVWPWHMEVNAEWPNDRPQPPIGEARPLVDQPTCRTHILILPMPALSVEGWTSLEKAQLAFHDHPVLTVDGNVLRIIREASF